VEIAKALGLKSTSPAPHWRKRRNLEKTEVVVSWSAGANKVCKLAKVRGSGLAITSFMQCEKLRTLC
jgi:hypothetical protein